MPEILIHKILQELMKKNNMSYRELSQLTKIPASTLKTWTNGNVHPRNLQHVYRVAEVFKVEFEYLIFGLKAKPKLRPSGDINTKEFFNGWVKVNIELPEI